MDSFAIGDRVKVRQNCKWEDQRGFVGVVYQIDSEAIWVEIESKYIADSIYNSPRFFYFFRDIDLIQGHKMVQPEFDLEEIELAESLIND